MSVLLSFIASLLAAAGVSPSPPPRIDPVMPSGFLGRWNLSASDCSNLSDHKQLRVGEKEIKLVQFTASVENVEIINNTTVHVTYMISDGAKTFRDDEVYILRQSGSALQVGSVSDAPVFYRCAPDS